MVCFQHDLETLLPLHWNEFCWQRNDLKIDTSAISSVRGSLCGGSAVGEQNGGWHYSIGINTFFWNECGGDESTGLKWGMSPERRSSPDNTWWSFPVTLCHVLTKHFPPDLAKQFFEGRREFSLCSIFTFLNREKLIKLSSAKMFDSSSGSTSLFLGRR